MEPLDDVTPERVGHDHQDEDRLVPDDAEEEPPQVERAGPLHMEQADDRRRECQEVRHAQVHAGATHALDEHRAGQHQHGQEDRIHDEDPEDEDQSGEDESGGGVDRCHDPHGGGQPEYRQPHRARPRVPLPVPRARSGALGRRCGAGAHRCVGGAVIGLVACRSGLCGRPMNRSGRIPSGSVRRAASPPPSAPDGRISRSHVFLTTLRVTRHSARDDRSAPPGGRRDRRRGRPRVPSAVNTVERGASAGQMSGRAPSPTPAGSARSTLALPGPLPSYPGHCPSPPKVSVR